MGNENLHYETPDLLSLCLTYIQPQRDNRSVVPENKTIFLSIHHLGRCQTLIDVRHAIIQLFSCFCIELAGLFHSVLLFYTY